MRRLLATAAVALAVAPGAHAVPSSQVRALAARAQSDPAALVKLRAIRVVDGRPLDVGAALGHAGGPALRARLRLLAGGSDTTAPVAAGASAKRILHERRFHGTSVPQPLHGAFAWLGRQIRRPWDWLAGRLPGGSDTLWAVVAALVVAFAAFVAHRFARQRGGLQVDAGSETRGGRRPSPAELERAADRAEQAGELALALRLRFRAGLLRLARARAIPERDSITSAEVGRALRSAEFDALARTFDEVVYGGRPAVRGDVQAARATWPRVLAAVGT